MPIGRALTLINYNEVMETTLGGNDMKAVIFTYYTVTYVVLGDSLLCTNGKSILAKYKSGLYIFKKNLVEWPIPDHDDEV